MRDSPVQNVRLHQLMVRLDSLTDLPSKPTQEGYEALKKVWGELLQLRREQLSPDDEAMRERVFYLANDILIKMDVQRQQAKGG